MHSSQRGAFQNNEGLHAFYNCQTHNPPPKKKKKLDHPLKKVATDTIKNQWQNNSNVP